MKLKLKIRQKILLFVLSVSTILYIGAIGYISISSRNSALDNAQQNAILTAREVAASVTKDFERDFALARTFAQAYSIYQSLDTTLWQGLFPKMYFPVLEKNEHIYTIWDSWEFYGYRPGYTKPYGRLSHTVWREDGKILERTSVRSENGDPPLYGKFKQDGVETLWEPYYDQVTEGKARSALMTTVGVPIEVESKYMGMVGLDIELTALQQMIASLRPVEGSYAFILSNGGLVAGHANSEFINKKIEDLWPDDVKEQDIKTGIGQAKEFYFIRTDESGEKHFVIFTPVEPADINSPWSLVLSIPQKVMTAEANRSFMISLLVAFFGLIILVVVLILVAENVTRPITKITKTLDRLSKGEIDKSMVLDIDSGDEIEQMSKALNISIEGLNQKTLFAEAIGDGNLDISLELLSSSDVLGKSLIEMQRSLQKASEEEEKRKAEDLKRSWANEGATLFADILRKNNNDLKVLCDEVITNLVKYLKANQGGIMICNNDNKDDIHFELYSTYAWDRKKFLQKRIEWGEGLVGACALEKKPIFLTKIPDSYVAITSGLGEANPKSIIIVPMIHEEEVLGVIEIASFKVFEDFEKDFLIHVADSIASTVSAVRVNARTRDLLEQTQIHAEEMAAQEEEMRQNMEELHATQEDANRKTMEIENLVNSLRSASYVVEYNLDGRIINVNSLYLEKVGFSLEQVLGKYFFDNMGLDESQLGRIKGFWANVIRGNAGKRKSVIIKDGVHYTFIENYIPVKDADGRVTKVIKLSYEPDEFENETN